MKTIIIDTYDHKGAHQQSEQDCLCNYQTDTLIANHEQEKVQCTACNNSRSFVTYWSLLSENDIINSYFV